MSCTVVVGGQFGSEGKGKTVAILARQHRRPWVVRCGGPNSGHSLTRNNTTVVLRQLPVAAASCPNAILLLAAGCAIDLNLIIQEIETWAIPRDRLFIDPRAVLITEEDRILESRLRESIASTGTGTGSALARRLLRDPGVVCASQSAELARRATVTAIAPLLQAAIRDGGDVIVEGSQGFGLSLLHSPDYPFVTSRDTTASAFASEVGLGPRDIGEVLVVVRTFPIRVGGYSGPLKNEISWDDVMRIGGDPHVIQEYTSVTRRLRRVAEFDRDFVSKACVYNSATGLAVMGLDRLDASVRGARRASDLSDKVRSFMHQLEAETDTPIVLAGTGFNADDAVCFRSELDSDRSFVEAAAIS